MQDGWMKKNKEMNMKHCHSCNQNIAFGGHKEGENIFCSKKCAGDYEASLNGFCQSCLDETIDESPGNMEIFSSVGTGWGPFGRKKCSQCKSIIKTKWIYFLVPLIPRGKYRVLYTRRSAGFADKEAEFMARKLKSE
jgi:hypothetical protein